MKSIKQLHKNQGKTIKRNINTIIGSKEIETANTEPNSIYERVEGYTEKYSIWNIYYRLAVTLLSLTRFEKQLEWNV